VELPEQTNRFHREKNVEGHDAGVTWTVPAVAQDTTRVDVPGPARLVPCTVLDTQMDALGLEVEYIPAEKMWEQARPGHGQYNQPRGRVDEPIAEDTEEGWMCPGILAPSKVRIGALRC
jgi:hypothetical protein